MKNAKKDATNLMQKDDAQKLKKSSLGFQDIGVNAGSYEEFKQRKLSQLSLLTEKITENENLKQITEEEEFLKGMKQSDNSTRIREKKGD